MQRTLTLAALAALCTLALTCKKEPPVVPPNGGPDTTSQNWSFTADSIGEFGSYLRDVILISENNAWAVGKIHVGDTLYNAAHWDGTEWTLVRVRFRLDYGSTVIVTDQIPVHSVFASTPSDIWFVSNVGGVSRLTNSTWTMLHFLLADGPGGARMWGTASSNMYFVSSNGRVTRYNGSTWQRLETNTTVDLLDVWGSPDGSVVWACGYRPGYSESVLLRYDGVSWQTVWRTPPPASNQPYEGLLQSLWSIGNDSLFVVGGEGLWRQPLSGGTARKEALLLGSFPTRIRGRARNDLFIAGFDGMMYHFNGSTWRRFHQLTNPLHVYNAVAATGNTVVAVGADYSATIQRGLVLVGSRP